MKKAIIIGASSGIGLALAKVLAQEDYEIGLVARRIDLLHHLQNELKVKTYVRQVDVAHTEEARLHVSDLIQEMQNVDLFIINAGIGVSNPELEWQKEKMTIDVNVLGFCAMANVAMHHFLKQKNGHLVGISSIAALRGAGGTTAYNASKAFVSNYLEGLRHGTIKNKTCITVTDIKPGFVDTDMVKGSKTFWMATPEKAAQQIYVAIQKKSPHAYITRRWRLIAWILKAAPRWLHHKL